MAHLVRVKAEVLAEMMNHALHEPCLECCGLLAGGEDVITRIFQTTNELASATEYSIEPKELFRVVREIRRAGLDLMGIYHSHPNSDNQPSPRDIDKAFYPDVAYFILASKAARKPMRAFSIRDGKAIELDIQIV